MGHSSAINRPKRLREGPKSDLGSGPGATLRHTYDLIDAKTLKGTKKRCSVCRECVNFTCGIYEFFEQSLCRRFGGLFGVVLGVLLGSVWASWPSWSRLWAILGRLDAIFDVLEFCLIFGSSTEAVCDIRAGLAKKINVGALPPA